MAGCSCSSSSAPSLRAGERGAGWPCHTPLGQHDHGAVLAAHVPGQGKQSPQQPAEMRAYLRGMRGAAPPGGRLVLLGEREPLGRVVDIAQHVRVAAPDEHVEEDEEKEETGGEGDGALR